MKSMTAYGRSSKVTSYGRWNVEIHSVNRKFLDISVHMPRDFLYFDVPVRKVISSYLQRGQVTVKIGFSREGTSVEEVERLVLQLKDVKDLFVAVADRLQLDKNQVYQLPFLMEQNQSVSPLHNKECEELYKNDLIDAVLEALRFCMQMKEAEGVELVSQIRRNISQIANFLHEVKIVAPKAIEKYRQRLLDRIQEVKALNPDDQDRILREVMLYSEKVDIAEEITRLTSHLKQLDDLFQSKEKSVGRTMDFLIQEMNREVNTICSKSDHLDLTLLGVKMKGEIEKIREQAQNIE